MYPMWIFSPAKYPLGQTNDQYVLEILAFFPISSHIFKDKGIGC